MRCIPSEIDIAYDVPTATIGCLVGEYPVDGSHI
jgi:hypothetical protein